MAATRQLWRCGGNGPHHFLQHDIGDSITTWHFEGLGYLDAFEDLVQFGFHKGQGREEGSIVIIHQRQCIEAGQEEDLLECLCFCVISIVHLGYIIRLGGH